MRAAGAAAVSSMIGGGGGGAADGWTIGEVCSGEAEEGSCGEYLPFPAAPAAAEPLTAAPPKSPSWARLRYEPYWSDGAKSE